MGEEGTMNSIRFGNSVIRYDVQRKPNRKTTQIFVDKSGVRVVTPSRMPGDKIRAMMKDNAKWIYKKQLWARNQNDIRITFKSGTKLPYLGKNYSLKVAKSTNDSITLSRGMFLVGAKSSSPEYVSEIFKGWLIKRGKKIIEDRVASLADKMGIEFKEINIKDQKGRWGSISNDMAININLSILCAPPNIIEYVIIHELCHFRIPNHSAKYWELLGKTMPDYESRKKWLDHNWKLLDF